MSICEMSWQHRLILTLAASAVYPASVGQARETDEWATIELQFRTLPMEARRLTGPLFWLHGDESPQRLKAYLEKVVEGGNGCFTAESRPHEDWLGPGWYRDLRVCLDTAKKLNLKMWIFDEQWWPSGEVGGKVPREYGSKYMEAAETDVVGPRRFTQPVTAKNLIKIVAGRETRKGIDGTTLIDLTGRITDGTLTWDVPEGKWKVMTFSWRYSEGRGGRLLVDGASRSAVDWYLRNVYQPHYEHFSEEFGKTIVGYFYDEPETRGDWGTEVLPLLEERGVDWKKALVSWKFALAGDEHLAAKYQYHDTYAEAWGRTLYGSLTRWCHAHDVQSIGHFLEHNWEYLKPELCAGNMVQLQKYSDMGAIDLVCQQFYPGSKDTRFFQMAKLGSSVSHVYGKADDLAMCEIFGAYGQEITYPQMKWLTDQMQVRGINFMIPHAFNPRAPHDRDCPPYFYNDGYEPRWPLYRVYADYTTRLSLMLAGGHHVCPIAFLYLGNSAHVGKSIVPEQMTTVLQDALFDCDWMPYDALEADTRIDGNELLLHKERYRVLVVPPVEVIPYAAMNKAKAFFEAGGIVVGYGFLPAKSATLGKTAADIADCREAIWGDDPKPGLNVCRTSPAGGRSYLMPEKPTPRQVRRVLTADAGLHPTLEVLEGDTNDWLHVLHRAKAGRDVFFVCNQNHKGQARQFTFRVRARGVPEIWDAMRNEISSIPYDRGDSSTVSLTLTLEPLESVLIVFRPEQRHLAARVEGATPLTANVIQVLRQPSPPPPPHAPPAQAELDTVTLDGCAWVWSPDVGSALSAPPGTQYFRRKVEIPANRKVKRALLVMTADNVFELFVDGRKTASGDNWSRLWKIDLTDRLGPGFRQLAVAARNGADHPNPAGLIGRLRVDFEQGPPLTIDIDGNWKTSSREQAGWTALTFDDRTWAVAKPVLEFGGGPWGRLSDRMLTLSPVEPDPFHGRFALPPDVDLDGIRAYLEADDIQPEAAARVTVNNRDAGGFIGRPLRLNVSTHLKPGDNAIVISPFAPKTAQVVLYSKKG
ncbi:MAG: hypothetical protein JSV19_11890 [Phycisphaerales bacterium]|nr:MAG: hypothetical protein JSV19_11890 [Phycisphaerales bacterium]